MNSVLFMIMACRNCTTLPRKQYMNVSLCLHVLATSFLSLHVIQAGSASMLSTLMMHASAKVVL